MSTLCLPVVPALFDARELDRAGADDPGRAVAHLLPLLPGDRLSPGDVLGVAVAVGADVVGVIVRDRRTVGLGQRRADGHLRLREDDTGLRFRASGDLEAD